MNFIATPAGAFFILSSCSLSAYITGNLIKKNKFPVVEFFIWVPISLFGGSFLLMSSTVGMSVQIFIYLLLLLSLSAFTFLIYTAYS
jgi:hypothetical protein